MSGIQVNSATCPNAMPMSSGGDNQERNIKKQIMNLQEQMQKLSQNDKMPAEEKDKRKKELQDQIQMLNNDLQQCQFQKRKKEMKTKQTQAKNETQQSNESEVIVTLSTTKKQISELHKVKTDLEGKLRTARNEGDIESLQNKVSGIEKRLSEKIAETNQDDQNNSKTKETKETKEEDEPQKENLLDVSI